MNRWSPYFLSMLRIVAAFVYGAHGTQKLFGFPAPFPVPRLPPLLVAGGMIETFGGLLLLIGLFTRPVAVILSGEMAVNGTLPELKDLVVFDILRNSACVECRKELLAGDFLFMEDSRPLCLRCADLDHLSYLPRGDTGLTRRARKYSSLSAVVVRFSRARKRYERQGVLVQQAALKIGPR